MISPPTFRGAGTIYHYLTNFTLCRDRYKAEPSFFHTNFMKQSCLFTLTQPSICKLLSNSAPSVTVASFDQVLATRESFESITRKLGSCNFSFRHEESYRADTDPLNFTLLPILLYMKGLRETKHVCMGYAWESCFEM